MANNILDNSKKKTLIIITIPIIPKVFKAQWLVTKENINDHGNGVYTYIKENFDYDRVASLKFTFNMYHVEYTIETKCVYVLNQAQSN